MNQFSMIYLKPDATECKQDDSRRKGPASWTIERIINKFMSFEHPWSLPRSSLHDLSKKGMAFAGILGRVGLRIMTHMFCNLTALFILLFTFRASHVHAESSNFLSIIELSLHIAYMK